ncbi:MAG: hypothetical protein AAF674_07785 [Pseudomonadota bacterium]
MSSWQQNKNREARGATLFMWIKIIAFVGFLAAVFALGGNPFTGELGGELGGDEAAAPADPATSTE